MTLHRNSWRRAAAGLAALAVLPLGATACAGEDPGQNGEQNGGTGEDTGQENGGEDDGGGY